MKKLSCLLFCCFLFCIYSNYAQENSYALIHEDYEIPARGIYQQWNNEDAFLDKLTIPFDENGKLKIILVEENNPFQMPCDFQKIVSTFGRNNMGVDLRVAPNDTAYCCFDGVVRVATTLPAFGKVVIVRHYNGLETVYSNLESIDVQANQKIAAGKKLGCIGRLGSTPQLHFEVRFMHTAINPISMIDFAAEELASNVLVVSSENISTNINQPYPSSSINPNARFHIVQSGDSLSKIAQAYHVSVEQLCRWNNLDETSILQLDQKIRVSE